MTWKTDLADMLDALGTQEGRLSGKSLTFRNLDELVFQLRKPDGAHPTTDVMAQFFVGAHVRHSSRGHGIVRSTKNNEIAIEFDDRPGSISARFDRDWFRINPELLKIEHYEG